MGKPVLIVLEGECQRNASIDESNQT